jgi:sugar phosphate isomerase/epimerase
MRLGVAGGIVPRELAAVTDRVAAKLADLGVTGVGTHFQGDPATLPREDLRRAREVFAAHGIAIVQSWGWQQPLVHPNEALRQAAVRTLGHAVRVAAELGAQSVLSGPGSLNPRGAWWPHPDNHGAAAEDALVRSLREVASVCEHYGVPIALECHVTSTLDSAVRVRRVLDQVESPWIRVSLDPVNFVKDLPTLWNTTPMLDELFDLLGPDIAAAHVKDVYVEDRLVVHISETVPGDGQLDFATFFRRFEALLPGGYGLVEHLPESLVPQALAFVKQKLGELDLPVRG